MEVPTPPEFRTETCSIIFRRGAPLLNGLQPVIQKGTPFRKIICEMHLWPGSMIENLCWPNLVGIVQHSRHIYQMHEFLSWFIQYSIIYFEEILLLRNTNPVTVSPVRGGTFDLFFDLWIVCLFSSHISILSCKILHRVYCMHACNAYILRYTEYNTPYKLYGVTAWKV